MPRDNEPERKRQRKIPLKRSDEPKKMNEVFLIHPRWNGPDIVYKVFLKGDDIYFCKVGGQFYYIKEIESKYNPDTEEDVLLGDKHNFKSGIDQIRAAVIDIKRSRRTGQTPNNGTLTLFIGGRKEKYIIHPYQTAKTVYRFFKDIPGISTELLNKNETINENAPKKYKSSEYKKTEEYKRVGEVTFKLNILGFISGLWIFIYAKPYVLAALINIAIPIIGVFIYTRFKYVEFESKKGSDRPDILYMMLMPSLGLFLASLTRVNLIYTKQLWIDIAIISLTIFVIILLKSEEYKKKKWLIPCIAVIIFVYVHGAFIVSNCAFDNTRPVKYATYITGKYKSAGKTTTYYLTLEPWGPFDEYNDIDVSKALYDKYVTGQQFDVFLMGGRWGFKWVKPAVN